MIQADLVLVTILALVKVINNFLGIIMAAITIQQVEQNLAAMPEEQRAVAEEAMGMLSDDQLQSVLDVFDIQLSMEEAPQLEEAPMEEPMAEDELPTLPMPEEEAPTVEAPPLDQEMQQLNLGGQAQVAGNKPTRRYFCNICLCS